MLIICDQCADRYDFNFNAKKSVVIRIGAKCKCTYNGVLLAGKPLEYVNELK